MPKKFKGENSKAVVAKARKAEAAAEEKAKKDKAIEDAYWQEDDKQINKKFARKDEKEKKRLADLEKKAELRQLQEQEEESLIINKPAPPQKITQFMVQKNKEKLQAEQERENESELNKSHLDEPLVENLNRLQGDVISASGIDAALNALSTSDSPAGDNVPGKKMAQAFKEFEEKRMPSLKKENPTLRLSQLKQALRKEWMKSPENPINQKS